MKLSRLLLAMLVTAAVGCTKRNAAWKDGSAMIEVSGTPGARITGFYFRDRERHDLTNSLPFTLSQTGLAQVVLRKVNVNETLSVKAHYSDHERGSGMASMVAPAGVRGVRVEFRDGFWVGSLKE